MTRAFNTDYTLYEGKEVADAIITDPPYGLTRAGYDEEIDLDAFWAFVKAHLREGGHLVSMADMAFAARLIGSCPREWSWYDLIWRKTTKTGFLNARRRPLRSHEIIMVFRRPGKGWTYNPQMTHGHERKVSSAASKAGCKETELYGRHKAKGYDSTDRYPESVLTFKTDKQKSCLHPSQKPVDLMRWLVRTYTNPGELVMDPFAGSGTTGVAAEIEGRESILIERDNNYFNIMEERINGRGKRTKIIYHSVDLDGVASAAIARVALEREGIHPELAPYDYGQPMPVVTNADSVYMLDVSLGPTTVEVLRQWIGNGIDVTWIDHHKTVIEYEGQDAIPGIRKVGEAACSLTWKHFNPGVPVPLYIDLLAAYDVWDQETYDWLKVMYYQYGMRARVGLSVAGMANLIRRMAKETRMSKVMDFIMDTTSNGEAILHYIAQKNAGELDRFAFTATVSGYRALCMNTTEFNSTTFDNMWDENEFDLMMPFCWDGNGGFARCSLYTTKDGVDCAAIARSFGGGGHAKAAGFQLTLGDFTHFLDFKRL